MWAEPREARARGGTATGGGARGQAPAGDRGRKHNLRHPVTVRDDDVGGDGRDDDDSVSRGGTPVPLSDGSGATPRGGAAGGEASERAGTSGTRATRRQATATVAAATGQGCVGEEAGRADSRGVSAALTRRRAGRGS